MKIIIKPKKITRKNFKKFGDLISTKKIKPININNGYAKRFDNLGKINTSLKKGNTYSGIGFDVHKLVKKKKLYLGGLRIPYSFGLEGHSDADPVLHSLIDGLLGACKLGDIGKLFSNRNKKYKNIRSTILLSEVIKLIKSKNFLINNIDINIITQKPKIQKYSKKIIYNISKLCEISSKQINVKGKTTEKLGLVGKGQAIASEAIVSVIKYD